MAKVDLPYGMDDFVRAREHALGRLAAERSEDSLWEVVIAFQDYEFSTYSGLTFSYNLKRGRSGAYTKELFIDRRKNSKSLAWSSVALAFRKVQELTDALHAAPLVDRPKALADIRGITYIYGLFYQFGLIDVPEPVKNKMDGAGEDGLADLLQKS